MTDPLELAIQLVQISWILAESGDIKNAKAKLENIPEDLLRMAKKEASRRKNEFRGLSN